MHDYDNPQLQVPHVIPSQAEWSCANLKLVEECLEFSSWEIYE
jgi:hypothetical protein